MPSAVGPQQAWFRNMAAAMVSISKLDGLEQWPTFIDKLPGAELSIFRSENDRNVIQAS